MPVSFNKKRNQIPYVVCHQTWKFYDCNQSTIKYETHPNNITKYLLWVRVSKHNTRIKNGVDLLYLRQFSEDLANPN